MATSPNSGSFLQPSWLARLSTGTKMFAVLTAALLPLGLIALFASLQSAQSKRLQREADTRMVATSEARQIDLLVLRGANMIRADLAMQPMDSRQCDMLLADNVRLIGSDSRFALFNAAGRPLCTTPGFSTKGLIPPRGRIGIDVLLLDASGGLRFAAASADGSFGVGELPIGLLRKAIPEGKSSYGIDLAQGATRIALFTPKRAYPLGEHLTVTAPVSGGQVNLALTVVISPIGAIEILLVLLPIMMWLAAAVIGWIVVNQLLLRPLAQLQRSVADYGPGMAFAPPRTTTPSREIRELGEAFRATAAQLAEREHALEEGLSHQVRLTREVHHRVKNNLQVVASLINLHARGTTGEVAAAYSSIQRRVDALAIVHRNHFAELEENRGIALRSLVSELTANLRATAPAEAQGMTITLDMMPAFINQDVAVPVAFLITELVELVMECDPRGGVAIALAYSQPRRALLSVEAPGLISEKCTAHPAREQFDRVILGLSRQLRAPLDYAGDIGRYAIDVAILPETSS